MNGSMLTQQFLDHIDVLEASDDYASRRRIYECLDMASGIFCRETKSLHTSITIDTVAGQQAYDLPPDFIDLFITQASGRSIIRYSDTINYCWPRLTTYERLYRKNLLTPQNTPNLFAIIDKPSTNDVITGSCSAAGAASNGLTLLTDPTKSYMTTTNRVWPRDIVHNHTDGSMGYVIQNFDATHLYTALFGGTDNDWTTSDTYTIQPASQKILFLDAPSAVTGHVMHISYVCMSEPVFSDFGMWRFSDRTCRGIAAGAASIFKREKKEYTEAKALAALFTDEIRQYKIELGNQKLKEGASHRRERL